jgi:transposase
VDVSKAALDAAIEPGGAFARFANDPAGLAELASFCRRHGVDLVAMEASGGYERRAFLGLWQSGLSCAVVNPLNVRRYAEALGILEKTDRIDAGVIARFAAARNISPTPLPSPAQQRLKALVTRLRQVTGDLTAQKQRRSSLLDNAEMLASLDEVIALLKRQSRSLEGEIASMIDDDPLWARLAQSWRSIKGVAGRTVARLHAELPEIGTLQQQIHCQARRACPARQRQRQAQGQAPHPRRSQWGAIDPVPCGRHCRSLRREPRCLPGKASRRRKGKDGRPDRTRPQTAGPPQCQSTRRACRICQCNLTTQIVALPTGEGARIIARQAFPSQLTMV